MTSGNHTHKSTRDDRRIDLDLPILDEALVERMGADDF
jgi:hypothetical protein